MIEAWFLILVWFNTEGDVTWTKTLRYHTEAACQAERGWYERPGPGMLPKGICVEVQRGH
jgi:hypothetical protein